MTVPYVRRARADDMPLVEGLLREMLSRSQHPDNALDEQRARETLASLRSTPAANILLLCTEREEPVGVMLALLTPLWWQHGDAAMDLGFYVAPGYRGHGLKLLRAYRRWARSFDSVREVYFNVSFGGPEGERAEKLAEHMGFTRMGGFYVERVAR